MNKKRFFRKTKIVFYFSHILSSALLIYLIPINLAKTFPGIDDGSGFPLLGASKMGVIS
jgi:hypothetical protein